MFFDSLVRNRRRKKDRQIQIRKEESMDRPNRKEVKKVIAQLRKLGISKEGIAAELKVSVISIQNWATENSAPNWPTYEAILVMLHKAKKERKK